MNASAAERLQTDCEVHRTPTVVPRGDRDPVTGLLNYEGFMYRVAEFDRTHHGPAIIATIHVADYATVRDAHGDGAAQLVLAHVGGILFKHIRQGEQRIAYVGNGDFMVLLPDRDEHDMRIIITHLREALFRKPLQLPTGGEMVRVKITCGTPEYLAPEDDFFDELPDRLVLLDSNGRRLKDHCALHPPPAFIYTGPTHKPHHAAA